MKHPTIMKKYTTISRLSMTTGKVVYSTSVYTTTPAVTMLNTTSSTIVVPTNMCRLRRSFFKDLSYSYRSL